MAKQKEKFLLVVSFLSGNNFPHKPRTKFQIEAKFDGEQLSTDPVDHNELIEINQELAWELDKKSLQLHKLQRSCIKVNCFALSDSNGKEHIGYIVLDVRSASDGVKKAKVYPLLQPKYPKLKPALQINIYIEEDQHIEEISSSAAAATTDVISNTKLGANPVRNETTIESNQPVRAILNEDEGYFQLGKPTAQSKTFIFTIIIAFARNLIKLIANPQPPSEPTSSQFFFIYTFLNNQVTTKPFSDIVSCKINCEKSAIRLHATIENLRKFFKQQNNLEILFCSENKIIGKTNLNWSKLLEQLNNSLLSPTDSPIVVDQLLKLEESIESATTSIVGGRTTPSDVVDFDTNTSPLIGIQCSLYMEKPDDDSILVLVDSGSKTNVDSSTKSNHHHQPQNNEVIYQNDSTTITVENMKKQRSSNNDDHQQTAAILNIKSGSTKPNGNENFQSYFTEEMQLKAAYELQLWKEQKEKEFEANLKKIEAKKFQALADAFKQHDVEREILVQKKIKEYSDLEVMLKNSLSEVEKREKQLAFNETQVARLKADLHHDYETKLVELREASKRVQEKADHQCNLQRSKIDNLEEEIAKYRRQIIDWEKRLADKETEFARYKEREHNRPEVKLQSEINILNLEKIELERKLDAQTKAKIHYKDQFTKCLQELALLKKREEANARALLKKQQAELDHLRLRYLAAEESELIKSDEKQLNTLKNEFEKLRISTQQSSASFGSLCTTAAAAASTAGGSENNDFKSSTYNNVETSTTMDPVLKQHINRLIDERDTLLRTGVYSNADTIIAELDRRIRDCLKEAKQTQK